LQAALYGNVDQYDAEVRQLEVVVALEALNATQLAGKLQTCMHVLRCKAHSRWLLYEQAAHWCVPA
jgi:hypothetical protein